MGRRGKALFLKGSRAVLHGFPPAAPGQRIGILGGSFDPPHDGHMLITRRALRRFGLDRVWWLVTPGNPLKSEGPASLERRLAACRALVTHPRVTVTGLEERLGTRYTADTLRQLLRLYPGVRFVWLMGADNMASLHRWEDWDWIMANVPVGVLSRPGAQLAAGLSPAARRFARARLPRHGVRALPFRRAPAWALLSGPMLEISSTALRRAGKWVR
jgi:nicotinate-nucleotide adenylyltransferase